MAGVSGQETQSLRCDNRGKHRSVTLVRPESLAGVSGQAGDLHRSLRCVRTKSPVWSQRRTKCKTQFLWTGRRLCPESPVLKTGVSGPAHQRLWCETPNAVVFPEDLSNMFHRTPTTTKTPIATQPQSYRHRLDLFTFEGSITVLCLIWILPKTLSTTVKYPNVVIKHTKHT